MVKYHLRHKMCCICGKPVFIVRSRYCPTCSRFAFRMKARQYPPKVVKTIWEYVRRYGYICYYTGMALDMEDPHSPWFCVFDHWAPHDSRKIVITSSLINGMKSDLSEGEFWYYAKALANFKRKHIKIKKKKPAYWDHNYAFLENETEAFLDPPAYPMARSGTCGICGKRLANKLFTYCPRCAKIVYRLRHESQHLPPDTIEDTINYIRKNGFTCYYTGMALNMTDPTSPWYCFLNHWRPGDLGKIVITSALLNVMKADLTEDEFWYYIQALADYKEKGKKILKKRPVFWNRLYPIQDAVDTFLDKN